MSGKSNVTVLHVDDEPDFAELTADFLKREDGIFTVKTAASASEGLEHLSHHDFDCIISDYDMPGQNGIEFLEVVREMAPDLPFILFTGKGSEAVAGDAISAGVTDYLQKERGTDQYAVLANRIRNVVERYRAENARERQREANETAHVGISILNEDGEFIYANRAYADLYGYDPEDILGQHWELVYPDHEVVVVRNEILPTIADEGSWSGETTGLRADSTTFPEDHRVVQTDSGELICSVRDLSAEQELQIDLTRFSTIVETLSDPVYVLDETGRFEYLNDAFVDLVGYGRETVLGATPALIKSPDAIERSEDHLGQILSSDGPDSVQFEIEIQPNDGEPIPCEDHMSVLPYEGESFEGSVGILRDITERKERENMLRRYHYTYESALSGIAIVGLDGELVDVNPAFLDIWGYDDEEDVIGRAAIDMWKDPERARSVLETIKERGHWEGELEAVRADGSTFHARGVNSHLTDSDGNPIGVIASFFDITERREREQALEQTSTVLRTIVENLPMGVLVEDTERDVLMVNDRLGETFGISIDSEELIGRDCAAAAEELAELFADPEGFTQGITERLERREPVQNEELPLADGRVVERDYVPYTLPEGEAHLWLYRDVTARKQRKQELERSNQFLQDTQEVANVGGWEVDLRTEPVQWTDEVYRIHGEPLEYQPTIEDGISFYHPDDRDTVRDAFERVTANGEPYDLELRIVRNGGEIRWVRTRGEPWRQNEEIVGVRGTFQDITERKEREEELRKQNERLDEFAGLISHDLRNPLTVALGRTTYLQQRYDGESAEQLDVIAGSLNRMEEIIDHTLMLARKGERVGDMEPIPLHELCGNCWQRVDTAEATLNYDLEGRIKIKGDGSKLKHVFENLFRNAIQHGHDSVTITIGRSGETGFYLEDDGPGIREDARKDVFEAGHSSERGGTGFGLAIVKRIAEAHGWGVSLTEGSDRGARFEFKNVEFVDTE